jgi:hypothetical protein
MVDSSTTTSRADPVESVVSYWFSLDRGWRATVLGLAVVTAHGLWQVV